MYKLSFALFVSYVLILSSELYGQDTRAGNLIRINLEEGTVNPADTLGSWEYYQHEYGGVESYYYGAIHKPGADYFLIKRSGWSYYPQLPWYNAVTSFALRSVENADDIHYGSIYGELDYTSPYMIWETQTIETSTGIWLLNGYFGNAFISNEDSLAVFTSLYEVPWDTVNLRLQHILGKIGDKYILAFYEQASQKHLYYIDDLEDSPDLDSSKFIPVHTEEDLIIEKAAQINENLFIVSAFSYELSDYAGVYISELKDTNWILKQKILAGPSEEWSFLNNTLYYIKNEYPNGPKLCKRVFSHADTLFLEEHILIDTLEENTLNFAFTDDYSYYAAISGVQLNVYSIAQEAWISSISLEGVLSPSMPFIDSPYVYIHQRIKTISINEDKGKVNLLTNKLSAYPNPFNPQTTIAFTLANSGKVELAVYDLLGRKVAELLNEYRDKGSYEVKFNGANLASGIYLYTIKAGNFVKTQKLMLLK